MKKALSAAAVFTLMLWLSLTALAAPGYAGTITLNGESLDTAALPAPPSSTAVLPLRTIAEADYGYAVWYGEEEQSSFFSLDGYHIAVDCRTGGIRVNGEVVPDVTASFVSGVTFVPQTLIDGLKGYSAQLEGQSLTVTTPNGKPLNRLARQIVGEVDLAAPTRPTEEGLKEYYGVDAAHFEEVVAFLPMMISADTIVIGKVQAGEMETVKMELESLRANTQKSFEQYLPIPLERAKNGQVVTSGDYIMLIISGDNATAIAQFRAGVEE